MLTKKEDKVVKSDNLYETYNYDQFRLIKGNRPVDKRHVAALVRSMKEIGNLMPEEPVQVNSRKEILDGQHRIAAAEIVGYPVYYVIRDTLTIDQVPALNSNKKNWTWYDFSVSHANRGNKNYAQLLELHKLFGTAFSQLILFCGHPTGRSSRSFKNGEFEIKNYDLTQRLLFQYHDVLDIVGIAGSRALAGALYRYMRTPSYDHKKMMQKLALYGEALRDSHTVDQCLVALEDIWRAK